MCDFLCYSYCGGKGDETTGAPSVTCGREDETRVKAGGQSGHDYGPVSQWFCQMSYYGRGQNKSNCIGWGRNIC